MVIIDILFQSTSDTSTLGTYFDRPVRARFPIYAACTSELIKCIKCPGRTNIVTYVIYIYIYTRIHNNIMYVAPLFPARLKGLICTRTITHLIAARPLTASTCKYICVCVYVYLYYIRTQTYTYVYDIRKCDIFPRH